MCQCNNIPCCCTPAEIFSSCQDWRCNQPYTTTTTTTSSTSTTTSSTTTTTTTEQEHYQFIIDNQSSYNDLYYVLTDADTGNIIVSGFVNSGQEINRTYIPPISHAEDYNVSQFQGNIMYIDVLEEANGYPPSTISYNYGVSSFNGSIGTVTGTIKLTITDTSPITTTTTSTTTSSTTTTSTSTSTSTTTSSTTTSTTSTTSTTTTTSTTIAPDPLIIRVKNIGINTVGFNLQAWNSLPNTPPTAPTLTQYFPNTGGTPIGGATTTFYSSDCGVGDYTKLKIQNTGNIGLNIYVYWSINNGSSYSLLRTFELPLYTGSGAYPQDEYTYLTVPNNTGVTNIIEMRILSF